MEHLTISHERLKYSILREIFYEIFLLQSSRFGEAMRWTRLPATTRYSAPISVWIRIIKPSPCKRYRHENCTVFGNYPAAHFIIRNRNKSVFQLPGMCTPVEIEKIPGKNFPQLAEYGYIRVSLKVQVIPDGSFQHFIFFPQLLCRAEKALGISENLQDAFTAAYGEGASCRRFVSLEAAQGYLDMLELKVFRQGENRFCNFYADALSEMIDTRTKVKDLIILEEGEIGYYQVKTDKAGVTYLAKQKREYIDLYMESAAEAGMPVAWYLMNELAERFLDENESAYRVIQIYDKGLKEELLYYMGAMEYQAKRYRRNLGYQD